MMRRISDGLCYAFGICVILMALHSGSVLAGVPASWTSTATVGCSLPTTRTFTGTLSSIASQWVGVIGVGANIGCGNNYSLGYVQETNGGMFFEGYPSGSFWIFATNPTCVSPATYSGTTGLCEDPAPPTCPAGQSGNPCAPDSAAPVAGTSAPEIGISTGTVDQWGNFTPGSAERDTLVAGGTLTYNCGGWECTVSAQEYNDAGGCSYPSAGGTNSCSFIPVYTGNPATVANAVPSSFTSGGSNASVPVAGCPAGYVLDASTSLCVTGATAGTASTATTPGTAPNQGTAACPAGYTLDQDGRCTGTASNGGGFGPTSCPAGFTRLGTTEVCTSTAQVAATGAAASAACGAPGQPVCNVKSDLDYTIPATEGLSASSVGVSSITPVSLGGPAASCPAPVQLPHGIVWSWTTVCNFASFLRPVVLALAWLSAGLMVLGAGKAEI